MFKGEDELFKRRNRKMHEKNKYIESKHIDVTDSYREDETSASESQDFSLKVSPNVPDTCDFIMDNSDKEIVIISDSSSSCSSPKYTNRQKCKFNRSLSRNTKVYILDSSDSDNSNSSNELFYRVSKGKKETGIINNQQKDFSINNIKRNNHVSTSNETSCSSEDMKAYKNDCNNLERKTHESTSQITVPKVTNINKGYSQVQNKILSRVHSSSSQSSTISNQTDEVFGQDSKFEKISSRYMTTKLTEREARKIINNMKLTRAIYESPRESVEENVTIDESDYDIHPAFSVKNNVKANHIILETPTDSETNFTQNSGVRVANLCETDINSTPNRPLNEDANNACAALSERKKRQISQWLKMQSPDSKSDSSFSNVPGSNRNSVSSGNSSLERLELNYETPNNRGMLRNVLVNEEKKTVENINKIVHPKTGKQSLLHDYIEKSKTNTLVLKTPKKPNAINERNISSASRTNTPQNVGIMDCADILDKLYGNVWREKANVLLPTSEPRKQMSHINSRIVQTEKKAIKDRIVCKENSEDNSDTSSKNGKPQGALTKGNQRKNRRHRDSFINDGTSSENENESSYYTALTNPRASTNSRQAKPPKSSAVVQRIRTICDSNTDSGSDSSAGSDNEESKSGSDTKDVRRRKLSFTDDESESSNTSEFDPGDNVPIKATTKKGTLQYVSKVNTKATPKATLNQKSEKSYSFLASLSESIPMANAHPDAKKYRTNFKNNKEDLCKRLYKLYNENVFDKKLPEDMSIEWNVRMRGTAGYCYNRKSIKALGGIVKSSRIVLATKILDTPDRLRDTLIHEMCHAAAWLINNVSDGHGPFWTEWANKATRTFPELPKIRRCHDYKIKTKFTYKCTGCGYSIGRHSKSLDVEKKRCGHCYGKFELLINKTTKSGTVQMQTPKKEPTAFALYVKENYGFVKKERNAKHGEVMRILGQQFSAIKIAKKPGTVD